MSKKITSIGERKDLAKGNLDRNKYYFQKCAVEEMEDYLRSFHSAMERDYVEIAVVLILEPLHPKHDNVFHKLIREEEPLKIDKRIYLRIQIIKVPNLLKGERFKTPFVTGKRRAVYQDLDSGFKTSAE